jgi:hypothetical protein
MSNIVDFKTSPQTADAAARIGAMLERLAARARPENFRAALVTIVRGDGGPEVRWESDAPNMALILELAAQSRRLVSGR